MNNDTVTISRAEYERLLKANEELTKQVEILTQQIALARRQRFGSSSEQSKYDDGSEQLSFLFNEADITDGIDNVQSAEFNAPSTEIYNLNGQRVNTPQRGIYIVNGRKVVVK